MDLFIVCTAECETQTEQASESVNSLREATDNFQAELSQLKVDHEAEVR